MGDRLLTLTRGIKSKKLRLLLLKTIRQRYLLVMVFLPLLHVIIFHYVPIYGITLAFRDFEPMKVYGGAWVGFKYFEMIFANDYIFRVILNTMLLSSLSFVTSFPVTLIFALLMNEVKEGLFKRFNQTVSYLPTFLSWVVVAGLVKQVLSPSSGIYGFICDLLGLDKIILLGETTPFVLILLISSLWKGVGYGAVVYLACISGINPELYEAADLDGASRLQKVRYITVPLLNNVITYSLIFASTGLLSANFDQIYNLMNPLVMSVADVLDVYFLRIGVQQGQYSFTTALSLARSLVGVFFIIVANTIAKKYSEFALW